MMSNVLRAKKRSLGQRLKKHAWLNQTSDWLKTKAADCHHLLVNFTQLWNAIRSEAQTR